MSNAPFDPTQQADDSLFAAPAPQETPAPPQETPQKAPESAPEATPVADYVPADEKPAAAPEKDDIARLLEDPSIPLALSSGTTFSIRQLRLREMLRLLRIVSRGSASALSSIELDFDNPDEFVQTFVALVVFSIPEAEDETIDFIRSMVDVAEKSGNDKYDAERRLSLVEELSNPELEDAITIITAIISHEGRDLAALGKRLRSLLAVANKMGQAPDALKPVAG